MDVTALAGGVGGAKLLIGLDAVSDLTAIVNVGDDDDIYGVRVSPDIDICTYWLAGIADTERGWGIAGDTFTVMDALRSLGRDAWFSLGDRDLATCLHRTQRLAAGMAPSQTADEIRRAFGVSATLLPATDEPVRTELVTADGRRLSFQQYFVKERQAPEVVEVLFSGISGAKPAPGVLEAIAEADVVIVCPSNPLLSIGPILALPEVRDALRAHPRVVAVSPLIRGEALKGPAANNLRGMGIEPRASQVARLYSDFIDAFAVDVRDRDEAPAVASLGVTPLVLDTIMSDRVRSIELARKVIGT